MQTNIYDEALKDIIENILSVSKELGVMFKKSKPFDKEPVSEEEQLIKYKSLTQEDTYKMIEQQGIEKVSQYADEMENLLARRQKNGLA